MAVKASTVSLATFRSFSCRALSNAFLSASGFSVCTCSLCAGIVFQPYHSNKVTVLSGFAYPLLESVVEVFVKLLKECGLTMSEAGVALVLNIAIGSQELAKRLGTGFEDFAKTSMTGAPYVVVVYALFCFAISKIADVPRLWPIRFVTRGFLDNACWSSS